MEDLNYGNILDFLFIIFYNFNSVYEEICGSNLSQKIGSIREGCLFFINMSKILSTSNVRLFLNTLSHVQAFIFLGPYHMVSSVGLIHSVEGSNTIINYYFSQQLKLLE
jgi:hypothetical protein